MEHSQGFLNIVRDAKTRVKEEDYRETKKKIDAGEKFLLVDVREDRCVIYRPGMITLEQLRSL